MSDLSYPAVNAAAQPRALHGATRRILTALVAGGVLVASSGAVYADDVYNDIDATVDAAAEAMSLTVGGLAGTTKLQVRATNGDGKNGCNFTGNNPLLELALESSNAAVAQVAPSTVQLDSCGDFENLTVTALAAGTTTISARQVSNTTGATFNLAPVTFTVTVTGAATTPQPPADTTAPSAPSIDLLAASDTGTSSTDNHTNDSTPTLAGSAEAGSTVEVFNGTTSLGTTTATATGAWTFTPTALASGNYAFTAKAKDAAGNVSNPSPSLSVSIDTATPPATINLVAASDTGLSSTDNVTSDNTPTLDGTAEAGSEVDIFNGTTFLTKATANSAGVWAATTGVLTDGSHQLTAQATDTAGNVSEASLTLTVQTDTVGPAAPTINLVDASDTGASNTDDVTSDSTPTLDGTAEAGSSVEVFKGTTRLGTATAGSDGKWAVTTGELTDGTHLLTAKATDTAGNVSSASLELTIRTDTAAPGAPTINLVDASDTGSSSTDNLTSDSTPTLDGTAEAGSSVEVFKGTTRLGTATAGSDGKWAVTTGELTDGTHVLTAKATDTAGNVSSASLELTIRTDTAAPAKPSINLVDASDTGASNTDNVTSDSTPTLDGTAEAGSSVKIFDGTTLLDTVTASPAGTWTITTAPLTDGTHVLTSQATDTAGNISEASVTLTVETDTVAPTAPSIDLDAASDTGASNSDNVTNDTTLKLDGTAEKGSTVSVFDGTVFLGTATAHETSGAWTYTTGALGAGVHELTAKAKDASGNESVASATLNVTVDTAAPAKPSINLVDASDTGASNTDNVTSDSTPTLDGTAEAGSSVKIFDGTTLLDTVTASPAGTWTITTAPLTDGTHVLTSQATDTAGNISEASVTLTVETDTVAPTAPSIDLDAASDTGASNSDNVTNDTTLKLDGTAEKGSTVSVFDGTVFLGTATAHETSGAWTYTTGALGAGVHELTAKAKDASGNESVASATLNVTVDTAAPAKPSINLVDASDTGASNTDNVTSDSTPTLDGTAEAGSSVKIFDGTTLLDTVTASPAGTWTITTAPLTDGTHVLTSQATDTAGNISEASVTLTVETDTVAPTAPSIDLDAASDTGASNSDNVTNDTTLKLDGTAEKGSTVSVFDGTVFLGTATAHETSGAWTYTTGALGAGVHELTAKAKDASGNESVASATLNVTVDTAAPAKPSINLVDASDTGASNTDNVTSDSTPTLDGTAEAGSSVKIFDGTTLLDTVTASPAGTWTITTAPLTDGTHVLTSQATDTAGNISEASVTLTVETDTVAPTAPSIDLDAASDTGASNSDNVTNDTTLKLDGTAEKGSTVSVFDGTVFLGTATAHETSGAWTYTTGALGAGVHELTAKAKDASGNESVASATLNVTVDTAAPAKPSINLVDASDTGASNTDNVTSDSTPTLDGTAEAGSSVKIFDGTTLLDTVTASPAGTWTITTAPLTDGTHVLTSQATDTAGNISEASVTLTVETDTVAPTAPSIDLDAASDTGASNSDNVTNDTTLKLDGTAEKGSTVSVFDGTVFLGTATAHETSGAWTYTTGALGAGVHELTAKAKDASGNESVASATLNVTVDTAAPAKPSINLVDASDTGASNTDNVTSDSTPTLDGTAEAGSSVKIFDGTTLLDTVTASPAGTWTITTAPLTDGTHVLTSQATDTAGNISEASVTLTVETDTVAPTAPSIDLDAASDTGASNSDNVTNDNTPTLRGAAEAGSTVRIFDGSTPVGVTTAAVAGTWSFTIMTTADGGHSFTATAEDGSGNASLASSALAINVDTAAPVVGMSSTITAGASYNFGAVPAQPTCDATDTLSGLNGSCSITGYSTAVGSHTLTAAATDKAGNTAEVTRSYSVTPYTTKGFYQPVDMGNVLNTVKAGSTVPLKFELFRGDSELTNVAEVKSVTYAKATCETGLPTDEIETLATSTAGLKYDTTGGQYVYTWKTPTAACYKITMTAVDGSTISALFKTR